jgi:hypothetical protein
MTSRAPNPLTDDEKATIRRMHADGATRNDIARALAPRSGNTITRWCARQDPPLTFDRTRIKAATEARLADLAERRGLLREKFLTRADELLDMFDKPVTVFNFGGRDNTYEERQLDRPTISDMRSLVQAAATASTQEIRIAQADAGHGDDAAKSLLMGLAAAIGVTSPDPPADDND